MKKLIAALVFCASLAGCSNMASFSSAGTGPSIGTNSLPLGKDGEFICTPGMEQAPDRLRRLTKREYLATLQDLLGANVPLASLQTELDQVDREAKTHDKFFDTNLPAPTNLKLLRAYNAVAAKAADILANDTVKRNATAGNACISATSVTDQCLDGLLDGFGYRAYRRPLSAAEKSLYRALYRTGSNTGDAFARVIEALLQAPPFLYHLTDQGTPVSGRSDLLTLTPHEVASRLSYMILGTMPDTALFDAARNGTLATSDGIRAQAARLASLARAKEQTREFFLQWFGVKDMPAITAAADAAGGIDATKFPEEAVQEMRGLIDEIISVQRGGLPQLLTTPLVIAHTPSLASVYGVPVSASPQAASQPGRKGLLTRAAFLVGQTEKSSPITRGVRVRTHLLCDHLGSPPPDVQSMGNAVDPLSSTRTQITAKTSSGACMGCHGQINGLGFALENFDGFGRFRTMETVTYNNQQAMHSIDAKVAAYIHAADEPEVDGAEELQQAMLASSKTSTCMTAQYYQYQTGRHASLEDGCALKDMHEVLKAANGSAVEMFKSAAAVPFIRTKKID